MQQGITLICGAGVDCLSDSHAIEIAFYEKWAEALGQSLLYASETGLKPAIFLICRSEEKTVSLTNYA
jgi:hypothetical protein